MSDPDYKSIRFRLPEWELIRDLAEDLSQDRPRKVYLPDAVMEAIKFYRDHHDKPGGDALGKARSKGVITE